jgi:hypothetical protein
MLHHISYSIPEFDVLLSKGESEDSSVGAGQVKRHATTPLHQTLEECGVHP